MACRPTNITFTQTSDRYRVNDSWLSRSNSSLCRSCAPRLCTASILLIPSSTVEVVSVPASRLASDRRRATPVIRKEDISTMGAASQANMTKEGTAEKLYCMVQMTTAMRKRLQTVQLECHNRSLRLPVCHTSRDTLHHRRFCH